MGMSLLLYTRADLPKIVECFENSGNTMPSERWEGFVTVEFWMALLKTPREEILRRGLATLNDSLEIVDELPDSLLGDEKKCGGGWYPIAGQPELLEDFAQKLEAGQEGLDPLLRRAIEPTQHVISSYPPANREHARVSGRESNRTMLAEELRELAAVLRRLEAEGHRDFAIIMN